MPTPKVNANAQNTLISRPKGSNFVNPFKASKASKASKTSGDDNLVYDLSLIETSKCYANLKAKVKKIDYLDDWNINDRPFHSNIKRHASALDKHAMKVEAIKDIRRKIKKHHVAWYTCAQKIMHINKKHGLDIKIKNDIASSFQDEKKTILQPYNLKPIILGEDAFGKDEALLEKNYILRKANYALNTVARPSNEPTKEANRERKINENLAMALISQRKWQENMDALLAYREDPLYQNAKIPVYYTDKTIEGVQLKAKEPAMTPTQYHDQPVAQRKVRIDNDEKRAKKDLATRFLHKHQKIQQQIKQTYLEKNKAEASESEQNTGAVSNDANENNTPVIEDNNVTSPKTVVSTNSNIEVEAEVYTNRIEVEAEVYTNRNVQQNNDVNDTPQESPENEMVSRRRNSGVSMQSNTSGVSMQSNTSGVSMQSSTSGVSTQSSTSGVQQSNTTVLELRPNTPPMPRPAGGKFVGNLEQTVALYDKMLELRAQKEAEQIVSIPTKEDREEEALKDLTQDESFGKKIINTIRNVFRRIFEWFSMLGPRNTSTSNDNSVDIQAETTEITEKKITNFDNKSKSWFDFIARIRTDYTPLDNYLDLLLNTSKQIINTAKESEQTIEYEVKKIVDEILTPWYKKPDNGEIYSVADFYNHNISSLLERHINLLDKNVNIQDNQNLVSQKTLIGTAKTLFMETNNFIVNLREKKQLKDVPVKNNREDIERSKYSGSPDQFSRDYVKYSDFEKNTIGVLEKHGLNENCFRGRFYE